MSKSTPASYSQVQRLLHWSVALLIFFNLLFPDGMNVWRHVVRQGRTPSQDEIFGANIHAYVGIAILLLAILRLVMRVVQGVPDETAKEPPLFRVAARLAHLALYALIFLMPLSGIAAYYFGVDVAGSIHAGPLKALLWALIVVHVAGALAHQFYWKTDVLRRMTIG